MKLLIVSLSNRGGGASRAVDRLATALTRSGIDVKVLLFQGEPSPYYKTAFIYNQGFDKLIFRIKVKLTKWIMNLFRNPSHDYRSVNIFPSTLLKVINESDVDIVNIHWIGAEMLSIEQMARIKKPVVWTLHDAWLLNGVYHVSPNDYVPYQAEIKPNFLDRICRWRKRRALSRIPLHIITPSRWINERFESSCYNKNGNSCVVIRNLIDELKWRPLDKNESKESLGFCHKKTHIIYIANNATKVFNKGYVFFHALTELCDDSVEFHVVGSMEQITEPHTISHGRINNADELVRLYSASDICLIPSLSENMPYTAVESLMCGTPILCFDTTGLSEIVQSGVNGYKAKKFDVDDLFRGLQCLMNFKFSKPIPETIDEFRSILNENRYIEEMKRLLSSTK